MLKRNLTYGMVPTLLLGMSLAAPAGAECTGPHPTCGQSSGQTGGNNDSRPPVVSYDSSFYGFTAGIYGAVNLPFQSGDVTDMSIEPSLPEGLQFNTATGGITGTPTTPTQGVTAFVIRAVNAAGQSASTVIRLAVNPSRASPTPSPEPSPSMTPVASATPRPSPSPSASPRPAASASPRPAASASPSPTVSPSPWRQMPQSAAWEGQPESGNLFSRLVSQLKAQERSRPR